MAPQAVSGTQAAGYPSRVSGSTPLGAYLNDHLAGSEAAIELIDKLRSTHDDVEFAAYLAELQQDVEADRGELERVFETLGNSSQCREEGSWVAAGESQQDHIRQHGQR